MNIEQMRSARGKKVPNQSVVTTEKGTYFQSYNSVIAFIPAGPEKIQLGPKWDYSQTTGKYRNQFLRETKAETQRKLDNGEYLLNPILSIE